MDLFTSGFLLSLSLCLGLGIVNIAIMKTGVERGAFPALMIGFGSGIGDLYMRLYLSLASRWFSSSLLSGGRSGLVERSFLSTSPSQWSDIHCRREHSPALCGLMHTTPRCSRISFGGLASPSRLRLPYSGLQRWGGSVIASTHMGSRLSLLDFFGGFFLASNLWSMVIACICHHGGKMMTPELMKGFSTASAGLFLYFAVKVFMNGYRTLL